jgi:hypothetical protein
MTKILIPALLLAGTAPLPAQFGAAVCNPNSTSYNRDVCMMQRMGDNIGQELGMLTKIAQDRRSEWAAADGKYPPVIVVSRPGQRLAPRRRAQRFPGEDAKQMEATAESLLGQFEAGMRAQPHALLDLPHTHLATACMLRALRCYMVLRGQDDVSPELARNTYWRFRATNRSPEAAKVVDNPEEAQILYESLLLASLSLDSDWQSARLRGDRGALQTLQRTAQIGLEETFGQNTADWVRQTDSEERMDQSMRSPRYNLRTPLWGERTTLRATPPPGAERPNDFQKSDDSVPPVSWRQFDFQKNEDFEYELRDHLKHANGTLRIGVRIAPDGARTLSITARLGGETLDQVFKYSLAEGWPPVASFAWAQTGLGRTVATLLLEPRPDLTSRVLTSGLEWTTQVGQTLAKNLVQSPCDRGPGLAGRSVMISLSQGSAAAGTRFYCVGSDVPLPLGVMDFGPGVSWSFNLNRRSAAQAPSQP